MAMIPQTLANLNLFVDGVSFQGDVTSPVSYTHL